MSRKHSPTTSSGGDAVGNPSIISNTNADNDLDVHQRRRRLSSFTTFAIPPPPPLPPPIPTATSSFPPYNTAHCSPPTTVRTPTPAASVGSVAASNSVEEERVQHRSSSRPKSGILRLDINKPRRSSGGSVEFRAQPQMLGEDVTPSSGVTSPHQLTVTWASQYDFNDEPQLKSKPMHRNSDAGTASGVVTERGKRSASQDDRSFDFSSNLGSPVHTLDYPQYPERRNSNNDIDNNNDEDDDEEDYSVSVSAIMQRRASVRGYRNKRGSRNSRRASSPMDHVLDSAERRRSSIYTTSSDEGTNQESTQEQIYENIRLHKEVIQSVKLQPWPMRKKLKLVRQAKTYVARHEGALQERFAMSRSTKDLWARFKILMAARWRHWKRETTSFLTVLIPWELRIKEIESHFGSGVASYFTFLRWLMWMNIMIAIPLVAFVIGPEYFATKHDETDPRKRISEDESKKAGNLFTIWEFEGFLKYSPMFYGYYSSYSGASALGYQIPLAYFLTAVFVYIYSFVATLRKMAENSRNSKLSSKDDECTFSWKLFTGWDFMIGHAETAHNRIASVVVGFKEALLEEAEKKKDNRNWRIILQRILVNILVMGLLAASGYSVVTLVNESEELARKYDNWLGRNAVNITMTLLSFFLPMIFEALGLFENWHPRQQLRFQLARIMILNMLNLYSLMFSFIYKINSKDRPLQELKKLNDTAGIEYNELVMTIELLKGLTTTTSTTTAATLSFQDITSTLTLDETSDFYGSSSSISTESALSSTVTAAATAIYSVVSRKKCYNITVKCSKPTRVSQHSLATTATMLVLNLTTAMLPATMMMTTTTNEPTTTNLWTTPDSTEASTLPTTTTETLLLTTLPPTTLEYTEPDDARVQTTIYTTDATDSSTLPPTTSTTTPSPGNDSFFDYADYFEGMPFDEEPLQQQTNAAQGVTTKAPVILERRQRRAAAVDAASMEVVGQTTEGRIAPRKSKYSRRKLDNAQLELETKNESSKNTTNQKSKGSVDDEDYNETTAITTTKLTTLITTLPTTQKTPNETETIATHISTAADDNNSNDVTTIATIADDDAVTTLQYNRSRLEDVLAYFITSTTTMEPPANTTLATTTTTATATTIETETDSVADVPTTPFFLGDEEIDDVGEINYYDASELNEDDFGNCIRTVCEYVTGTPETKATTMPTTKLMSTLRTELATTTLTPLEAHQKRLFEVKQTLSTVESNLTSMCWETLLGQELSKVIVFDGVMSIVVPLCIDFLRALFVRYLNQYWCWDMEKTFPQYGDFKIAENILTLINNQGQVWMGIFFSPGLVIINLVKLIIMMYFRSWVVLTCNVPHEVVFKASKSNNFYLSLLLTMLFLCVLPVGYAIVWLRPSWHCGPFSEFKTISAFITNTTRESLPKELHEPLNYMTSSSTVIPLLLLLILIIYYLVSLTGALREANQDLRTQLQKEREEERKKIFKLPEAKPAEPTAAALTNRWRKVLEASSPVTPSPAPDFETDEYKNQARKELISRIMKQALRKGSATSEEESVVRQGRDDDDTDTEHHDSLPLDEDGKERRLGLTKLQKIRRTRKPSLVDIVQIARSERDRAAKLQSSAAAKEATTTATVPHKIEGRFRIDKPLAEKKSTKKHSPPPATTPDNDNDPDINSRIVNERRASLLRRKPPDVDDEAKRTKDAKIDTKPVKKFPTLSTADANIVVVDEKRSPTETSPQSAENKAKLKRQKQIDVSHGPSTTVGVSSSPEVFKFDEKSLERSHNTKLGRPVNIPTIPATSPPQLKADVQQPTAKHSELQVTTPPTLVSKQHNAEKLANFSRQGRKKIGSFFALMREAVNAIKTDNETSSSGDEAELPKTPKLKHGAINQPNESINTAIVMPPAREQKEPPPNPAATTTAVATQPISNIKIAPLEDPEELDQAGPITFPIRSLSQRRKTIERPPPLRQDSQTSVWSDNIPTITISHTGSEECIVEPEDATLPSPTPTTPTTPSTPGSVVNIIKIQIEDDENNGDNVKS